ncbi:MAG: YbaK/EbsC family protein [Nitrososphaera sp.]|nr:YbaK/EbsC family protein [Nitrososphaera sp.]
MAHLSSDKLSQLHPRVASALSMASFDMRQVRIRCHSDLPIPIKSPTDFASALGYELERVTKTLLVRPSGSKQGGQEELSGQIPYALTVLSVNHRFNVKTVAQALKVNRVEIAKETELDEILSTNR